jgi:archaellin
MVKRKQKGSVGLIAIILLLSALLIGVTAASLISITTSENLSEEEIKQIVDDTIDEITTYIQIKDVIGKYYGEPTQQRIEKIAIMITPLFSKEIDVSSLKIRISNENSLHFLSYGFKVDEIGSNPLFENCLWEYLSNLSFGLMVINDKDHSIKNFNTFNQNSDVAYILINLSKDYKMKKGDEISITIFPPHGIEKSIILQAPLPIKNIVSFE